MKDTMKTPPKRTTTHVTDAAIKALIAQGVATALAEYEANGESGNGDDRHDSGSGRRTECATRECTYSDFLKCQPLNFKGTEGVFGLTQWFKKIESVFHISNCTVACQIKFATSTLLGNAMTWWNSHVKIRRDQEAGDRNVEPEGQGNGRCELHTTLLGIGTDVRENVSRGVRSRHYKSDCPELKNQNHINQNGGTEARGMVYALGGGETDQDLDDMEDDINS
uniref:Reverse transcriptase domain-containing protein n=1 Tax=Tanacetum cinerariifolium TaxID=118510 RepID=A0A6L2KK43_TANCI|nr:hypothetical protein [Tanacetum cinerariifolium]